MAMRRRRLAGEVIGVFRRQVSLDEARKIGAVDRGTMELPEAVEGADLVVLAVNVQAMPGLAAQAAPMMKRGSLLTDVGSTKLMLSREIAAIVPPGVHYIPSHPMAGSERRGPACAREDLFDGSVCILTPLPDTPGEVLEKTRELWRGVGGRVVELSPERHDALVAQASHAPHLIAAALMNATSREAIELAGGGFAGMTRIAAGDPPMWRDIVETNPDFVLAALYAFSRSLNEVSEMIRRGDFESLEALLGKAQASRAELDERRAGMRKEHA